MYKKLKNSDEGVCPFCGCSAIDYNGHLLEDELTFYAECPNCGKKWDEVYQIVFDGNYVEVEDE